MDRLFDRVIVRPPSKSYKNCVSKNPEHHTIDIEKTLNQHENYVQTLEDEGIEVTKLSPSEEYPDSIYVQDTALIESKTNKAVICRFGEAKRRGEEESIARRLENEGFKVKNIEEPGTIEGGDILVTDQNKVFVGISERTNEKGIEQLSDYFSNTEVIKVPVSKVFHLLSGVNFIGNNTLAVCPELVDISYFEGFDLIEINKHQQDTEYPGKPINMLYLGNDKILLPDVYPNTEKILKENGYDTITINLSEFWKGDAGTTCPMLPFYNEL